MGEKLKAFLERTVKIELKWMHHYDVDDSQFGVETDKYRWCKQALEGRISIEELVMYFEKYYPNDEHRFIQKIKEVM